MRPRPVAQGGTSGWEVTDGLAWEDLMHPIVRSGMQALTGAQPHMKEAEDAQSDVCVGSGTRSGGVNICTGCL